MNHSDDVAEEGDYYQHRYVIADPFRHLMCVESMILRSRTQSSVLVSALYVIRLPCVLSVGRLWMPLAKIHPDSSAGLARTSLSHLLWHSLHKRAYAPSMWRLAGRVTSQCLRTKTSLTRPRKRRITPQGLSKCRLMSPHVPNTSSLTEPELEYYFFKLRRNVDPLQWRPRVSQPRLASTRANMLSDMQSPPKGTR